MLVLERVCVCVGARLHSLETIMHSDILSGTFLLLERMMEGCPSLIDCIHELISARRS